MKRATLLFLFFAAACVPAAEPVELRPTTIEEFVERLEADLEAHEWQSILAAADPLYYRARVVDARAAEPNFLAETLGVHGAPNSIQDGEELDWDDFERIEAVDFISPSGSGERYAVSGTATLDDGTVLQIRANVTRVQGRFVLTAP